MKFIDIIQINNSKKVLKLISTFNKNVLEVPVAVANPKRPALVETEFA